MEQITVSEPNNLSYIQETPRLLWNSKFRHHVCKTAPLLTTLTLLHSAHNRTSFGLTTVYNIPFHLCLVTPNCPLPFGFRFKLCTHFSSVLCTPHVLHFMYLF